MGLQWAGSIGAHFVLSVYKTELTVWSHTHVLKTLVVLTSFSFVVRLSSYQTVLTARPQYEQRT